MSGTGTDSKLCLCDSLLEGKKGMVFCLDTVSVHSIDISIGVGVCMTLSVCGISSDLVADFHQTCGGISFKKL